MKRSIFIATLIFAISCITYPIYKQCDSKWGSEQLGTSPVNTICKAGCLLSSAAMALTGTVANFNPSTLNQYLIKNGGYVKDDLFVWAAIDPLGLTFSDFINNNQIKQYLDNGYVVILNVNKGGHWVLAHSYDGDNINVNDPGYTKTYYPLSEVVDGNTGVYTVKRKQLQAQE